MLLRSRIVLPMTAPSVEDGAVLISRDRITAVGPYRELAGVATGPVMDLGDAVLLPGLVNAHCHLDYTRLAGHLAPPRRFTDWLQGVLGLKAGWSFSEFADSWLAGAGELLRSGCTAVMDYEAVPELLPDAWHGTPLRVLSAMEITGIRSGRQPEDIIEEVLGRFERLQPLPSGKALALAPHAPYSTRPELLKRSALAAQERGMRISCHVAESADEFEMFMAAGGPMFQWLKGQRDMSDCGKGSPLKHVAGLGLLSPRTQLVHVNHLAEGDLEILAKSGAGVVHCPRSHDYFGHVPFEYEQMVAAGVPVCLGTDSLLSVRRSGRGGIPRLSLFEEMRSFHRTHPSVSPTELLRMVTVLGAAQMGWGGEIGELRTGCLADLAVVPYRGSAAEAEAGVVHHTGDVAGVMIGGKWILLPQGAGSAS
jgi:cytosine/adenosine deaminase-related metal-dependent hydrolase